MSIHYMIKVILDIYDLVIYNIGDKCYNLRKKEKNNVGNT